MLAGSRRLVHRVGAGRAPIWRLVAWAESGLRAGVRLQHPYVHM